MNLYILRHGIAVEPGTRGFAKDADRPLTPKGKRKVGKIANAIDAMGLSFDLILSSPYVRARQTAEIIAGALCCQRRLELTDALVPSGNPGKVLGLLMRGGNPMEGPGVAVHRKPPARPLKNVMLVGHEPYLSSMVSLLITGNSHASIVLKKGGLCKLSAETLKAGRCAQLEWLLTPKQLLRLG
jgi:phosphohistidine phosphatase